MDTLRAEVDEALRETQAYQRIRELLQRQAGQGINDATAADSEQAALERLLARTLPSSVCSHPLDPLGSVNGPGVVDFPVGSIQPDLRGLARGAGMQTCTGSDSSSLVLRVRLDGGRAFQGGRGVGRDVRMALRVHLSFGGQRAMSDSVVLDSTNDEDPQFSGVFDFVVRELLPGVRLLHRQGVPPP